MVQSQTEDKDLNLSTKDQKPVISHLTIQIVQLKAQFYLNRKSIKPQNVEREKIAHPKLLPDLNMDKLIDLRFLFDCQQASCDLKVLNGFNVEGIPMKNYWFQNLNDMSSIDDNDFEGPNFAIDNSACLQLLLKNIKVKWCTIFDDSIGEFQSPIQGEPSDTTFKYPSPPINERTKHPFTHSIHIGNQYCQLNKYCLPLLYFSSQTWIQDWQNVFIVQQWPNNLYKLLLIILITKLGEQAQILPPESDPLFLSRPSNIWRLRSRPFQSDDGWKLLAYFRQCHRFLSLDALNEIKLALNMKRKQWLKECYLQFDKNSIESESTSTQKVFDKIINLFKNWRHWEMGDLSKSSLIRDQICDLNRFHKNYQQEGLSSAKNFAYIFNSILSHVTRIKVKVNETTVRIYEMQVNHSTIAQKKLHLIFLLRRNHIPSISSPAKKAWNDKGSILSSHSDIFTSPINLLPIDPVYDVTWQIHYESLGFHFHPSISIFIQSIVFLTMHISSLPKNEKDTIEKHNNDNNMQQSMMTNYRSNSIPISQDLSPTSFSSKNVPKYQSVDRVRSISVSTDQKILEASFMSTLQSNIVSTHGSNASPIVSSSTDRRASFTSSKAPSVITNSTYIGSSSVKGSRLKAFYHIIGFISIDTIEVVINLNHLHLTLSIHDLVGSSQYLFEKQPLKNENFIDWIQCIQQFTSSFNIKEIRHNVQHTNHLQFKSWNISISHDMNQSDKFSEKSRSTDSLIVNLEFQDLSITEAVRRDVGKSSNPQRGATKKTNSRRLRKTILIPTIVMKVKCASINMPKNLIEIHGIIDQWRQGDFLTSKTSILSLMKTLKLTKLEQKSNLSHICLSEINDDNNDSSNNKDNLWNQFKISFFLQEFVCNANALPSLSIQTQFADAHVSMQRSDLNVDNPLHTNYVGWIGKQTWLLYGNILTVDETATSVIPAVRFSGTIFDKSQNSINMEDGILSMEKMRGKRFSSATDISIEIIELSLSSHFLHQITIAQTILVTELNNLLVLVLFDTKDIKERSSVYMNERLNFKDNTEHKKDPSNSLSSKASLKSLKSYLKAGDKEVFINWTHSAKVRLKGLHLNITRMNSCLQISSEALVGFISNVLNPLEADLSFVEEMSNSTKVRWGFNLSSLKLCLYSLSETPMKDQQLLARVVLSLIVRNIHPPQSEIDSKKLKKRKNQNSSEYTILDHLYICINTLEGIIHPMSIILILDTFASLRKELLQIHEDAKKNLKELTETTKRLLETLDVDLSNNRTNIIEIETSKEFLEDSSVTAVKSIPNIYAQKPPSSETYSTSKAHLRLSTKTYHHYQIQRFSVAIPLTTERISLDFDSNESKNKIENSSIFIFNIRLIDIVRKSASKRHYETNLKFTLKDLCGQFSETLDLNELSNFATLSKMKSTRFRLPQIILKLKSDCTEKFNTELSALDSKKRETVFIRLHAIIDGFELDLDFLFAQYITNLVATYRQLMVLLLTHAAKEGISLESMLNIMPSKSVKDSEISKKKIYTYEVVEGHIFFKESQIRLHFKGGIAQKLGIKSTITGANSANVVNLNKKIDNHAGRATERIKAIRRASINTLKPISNYNKLNDSVKTEVPNNNWSSIIDHDSGSTTLIIIPSSKSILTSTHIPKISDHRMYFCEFNINKSDNKINPECVYFLTHFWSLLNKSSIWADRNSNLSSKASSHTDISDSIEAKYNDSSSPSSTESDTVQSNEVNNKIVIARSHFLLSFLKTLPSISLHINIAEIKFHSSCFPHSKVEVALSIQSTKALMSFGKIAKIESDFSFVGETKGISIRLRHEYSPEDCIAFRLDKIIYNSVLTVKDALKDEEECLAFTANIVKPHGNINLRHLQDLILFQKIWFPMLFQTKPVVKEVKEDHHNKKKDNSIDEVQELEVQVMTKKWPSILWIINVANGVLLVDLTHAIGKITTDLQQMIVKGKWQNGQTFGTTITLNQIFSKADGRLHGVIANMNHLRFDIHFSLESNQTLDALKSDDILNIHSPTEISSKDLSSPTSPLIPYLVSSTQSSKKPNYYPFIKFEIHVQQISTLLEFNFEKLIVLDLQKVSMESNRRWHSSKSLNGVELLFHLQLKMDQVLGIVGRNTLPLLLLVRQKLESIIEGKYKIALEQISDSTTSENQDTPIDISFNTIADINSTSKSDSDDSYKYSKASTSTSTTLKCTTRFVKESLRKFQQFPRQRIWPILQLTVCIQRMRLAFLKEKVVPETDCVEINIEKFKFDDQYTCDQELSVQQELFIQLNANALFRKLSGMKQTNKEKNMSNHQLKQQSAAWDVPDWLTYISSCAPKTIMNLPTTELLMNTSNKLDSLTIHYQFRVIFAASIDVNLNLSFFQLLKEIAANYRAELNKSKDLPYSDFDDRIDSSQHSKQKSHPIKSKLSTNTNDVLKGNQESADFLQFIATNAVILEPQLKVIEGATPKEVLGWLGIDKKTLPIHFYEALLPINDHLLTLFILHQKIYSI